MTALRSLLFPPHAASLSPPSQELLSARQRSRMDLRALMAFLAARIRGAAARAPTVAAPHTTDSPQPATAAAAPPADVHAQQGQGRQGRGRGWRKQAAEGGTAGAGAETEAAARAVVPGVPKGLREVDLGPQMTLRGLATEARKHLAGGSGATGAAGGTGGGGGDGKAAGAGDAAGKDASAGDGRGERDGEKGAGSGGEVERADGGEAAVGSDGSAQQQVSEHRVFLALLNLAHQSNLAWQQRQQQQQQQRAGGAEGARAGPTTTLSHAWADGVVALRQGPDGDVQVALYVQNSGS